MKKLLLSFLFIFPLSIIAQNSFLNNDYQLFKKHSISEILNEARMQGYSVMNSSNGNMIKYAGIHPIIELQLRIGKGNTNFEYYQIGFVQKILYLMDDDLDEIYIWKVETVISLYPYENISSSTINRRFSKVEKYIKKSLMQKKYKFFDKSERFSFKDSYDNSYNFLEDSKFSNKSDTIQISIGYSSTKVLNKDKNEYMPMEKMIIMTEDVIHGAFFNSLQELSEKTSNKSLEKLKYVINNQDIRDVNIYDLEAFINVFLDDCKKSNLKINFDQKITATFEALDDPLIALAYGLGLDDEIIIVVDPMKWKNASIEKKWYVMYHELGHDVLNFKHGQAGKMMFNFADREYTWDEFFEDKKYMFNLKKNNQ
ncbi:MAG: hypothetical protein CMC04_04605 [Flavobacteriaceae bacterium]|nr:hypothetical protein [Flavobacteriaceae bacterium]|tara:strand:- start:3238 stop:4344 length:1107 start_codon:yes stop_codon:yes gene_type:complete